MPGEARGFMYGEEAKIKAEEFHPNMFEQVTYPEYEDS